MDIIIGKDIRTYKVKDIGPLSMREALCTAVALGCAYGVYALEKVYIDTINIIPIMLATVPALLVGFIRPYGLSLEKYIQTAFAENFSNPKVRLYDSDLKYSIEELVQMVGPDAATDLLQDEKKKKKNNKKAAKKVRLTREQRKKMRGYK